MDWKFTFVALILFPSCIIPIQVFGKRARRAMQEQQEDLGKMSVTMQETFAGIRVVKSFAREEQQEKSFARSTMLQFRNMMRMIKATEITGPLIEVLGAIGVGWALLYVYAANLHVGRFFALFTGIYILYDPAKNLSKLRVIMQRSIAATEGIFAILDTPVTIQDAPDAKTLQSSQGRIDFDNVTFRYAGTSIDALSHVTLRIEPGKSYALVGASGAGKSTILSLILRLYDPTSGAVRIDGSDLRGLTQQSLREQIGLVTQETFLFHDTIYNNILFGRLDATRDDVYRAAQMAYAHEFILAQPKKYDTLVGDKGMLLSGGQQQRLAIARAVLKNAPILLLDEATSALDSESEKQIQMALQTLAAGKTVVAIAHRLSTILSSDQIIVMLARQIEEGAPADVFFSADEAQMNRLQNKIAPATRCDLLTNVLVVIARKDSAQNLTELSDLAKPEVARIVIADPQGVPAGVYAKEVLTKAKLWDRIEPKVAPVENVRAALAVVEAGNADAGFVYKTDAMISAKVRIVLEIPVEFAPKIVYPAAIVAGSPHQDQAQRFLAFLKTEEAGQIFRRLGFGITQ